MIWLLAIWMIGVALSAIAFARLYEDGWGAVVLCLFWPITQGLILIVAALMGISPWPDFAASKEG